MCGIVAILGLLPFTFRVLTAWRTIVFSRPANLLITIHSIPIYGHTHLSMLRSPELFEYALPTLPEEIKRTTGTGLGLSWHPDRMLNPAHSYACRLFLSF